MHIHKVSGVRIKSQVIGEGEGEFQAHTVQFYSSYAEASICVTFYTDLGRRLTVNGGSKWGKCPDLTQEIAREDIHMLGERLGKVGKDHTLSSTNNYIQNVYGDSGRHLLSYVTTAPVDLEIVDEPTGGGK